MNFSELSSFLAFFFKNLRKNYKGEKTKMNCEDFEELIFLWQEYACEKDSNLTRDAQKLKQNTLLFIKSLPDLPGNLANPPKKEKK
jgi:hypothetical protein